MRPIPNGTRVRLHALNGQPAQVGKVLAYEKQHDVYLVEVEGRRSNTDPDGLREVHRRYFTVLR